MYFVGHHPRKGMLDFDQLEGNGPARRNEGGGRGDSIPSFLQIMSAYAAVGKHNHTRPLHDLTTEVRNAHHGIRSLRADLYQDLHESEWLGISLDGRTDLQTITTRSRASQTVMPSHRAKGGNNQK